MKPDRTRYSETHKNVEYNYKWLCIGIEKINFDDKLIKRNSSLYTAQ